jgi:hypothetical protein
MLGCLGCLIFYEPDSGNLRVDDSIEAARLAVNGAIAANQVSLHQVGGPEVRKHLKPARFNIAFSPIFRDTEDPGLPTLRADPQFRYSDFISTISLCFPESHTLIRQQSAL